MVPTFRKTLAWLRGRWHADLEFQHGIQRQALQDRVGQLLADLSQQLQILAQLDDRTTHLDTNFATLDANLVMLDASIATLTNSSAEVSTRVGAVEHRQTQLAATIGERVQNMETVLGATALEMSARVHAAAVEMGVSLHTTAAMSGERLAAVSGAVAELAHTHCETEARIAERFAALEQQLAVATETERVNASNWQQATQWMAEIAQQLRDERSRQQEGVASQQQAVRPSLTDEARVAIERQGVFVVGCARSGTTILGDCLNASREVYLLHEGFFFTCEAEAELAGKENYNFAAAFNARHERYGNQRSKGTYVPVAEKPDRSPLEFMHRLLPRYRYLGEKVAFGPAPHPMGDRWEEDFLAYQARHFYDSRYFITVRAPHEAIWSMHKMFPDHTIPALFENWLRSLRTTLDLYLAFPNTHFTLLEWLDDRAVGRIADVLQTEITLPRDTLGRKHQNSTLRDWKLIPVLRQYSGWCEQTALIYDDLRAELCVETMRFTEKARVRERIAELRSQIAGVLNEVMERIEQRKQHDAAKAA